jgi:pyruvate,orthophosphate dikinase
VFASWGSPRAVAYRNHQRMSHDGGTAVTVQAMVYGNLDDRSGTGVLFTRDPQSGDPTPMGEFLPRGQGEDVVSGEVDPLDLADLAQRLPEVHAALLAAGRALERHARDVQDVEFTWSAAGCTCCRPGTRNGRPAPR